MNEDRAQPAAAASRALSEPAPPAIDRRALLRGGLSLGGAALLGGALAPASSQALALADAQPGFDPSLPEKFRDPQWNRDAFARLQGSLKFGEVKSGWYAGVVHGVLEGQAVKPLMGFEGFSKARLLDRGDGSYQKVLREVLFYTDLQTGEVLETYRNPYTDEQVPVVHIANDPFNMLIEQYRPKGPTYGGLHKPDEQRAPLLLPWKITRQNTVLLSADIHLYYPSALQPDKWPRESAGPMNRVSEMFRYVIRREELEDQSILSLNYTGSWSRITPWLPWMLMGQRPGHIFYLGGMGGYDDLGMASPQILAYAEKRFPKYFDAPEKWEEPSLSSLENYALRQKPAPAKPPESAQDGRL